MQVRFNGKPFDPKALTDSIMAAAIQQLADQLRIQLGGIRDPDTGEFPTIAVSGQTLQDLKITIEGSDDLMAIVGQHLEDEFDAEDDQVDSERPITAPRVFLSFSYADKSLAEQIAKLLSSNGVQTWFADWEIGPGDSLRQRIDEGLSNCTHFVVLLTPNSINRPWVNTEIDAGLVRKIEDGRKFIPLRKDLSVDKLTPILRTLFSPELMDLEADIKQLVSDIFGVARRPPIGSPPPAVQRGRVSRVSTAATAIARLFVESSKEGQLGDPTYAISEIARQTELSHDDVKDGLFELRDLVRVRDGYTSMEPTVLPKPTLFAEFDQHWKPWDPRMDAKELAAATQNNPFFPESVAEIAKLLPWPARRLNAAIAYLSARGLVKTYEVLAMGPYIADRLRATDHTRRFVKSGT